MAALAAVELEPAGDIAGRRRALLVDITGHRAAVGARRRVEGLLALGHTYAVISAAGGADLSRVLERDVWTIPADRHAATLRAWSALSATPGESRQVRARALAAGYLPPCAWDDDADLDDPDAGPARRVEWEIPPDGWDESTAAPVLWDGRPLHGSAGLAALIEDTGFLAQRGEATHRAAVRLGRTISALERALYRAGRGDLWVSLRRNGATS